MKVDSVIIGAGHAGIAAPRTPCGKGIQYVHVVEEHLAAELGAVVDEQAIVLSDCSWGAPLPGSEWIEADSFTTGTGMAVVVIF
jgi:flavin-dependent dehydrogenase